MYYLIYVTIPRLGHSTRVIFGGTYHAGDILLYGPCDHMTGVEYFISTTPTHNRVPFYTELTSEAMEILDAVTRINMGLKPALSITADTESSQADNTMWDIVVEDGKALISLTLNILDITEFTQLLKEEGYTIVS